MNKLTVFSNRHPLVGPLMWVSSLQFFVVQLIVIAAWPVRHSWSNNYISDLGNTQCGMFDGLAVCSPLHALMNVSFITFGLTMAAGAALMYQRSESSARSRVAFSMMVIAGIGTIFVGLFPENTIAELHTFGAFLSLGVGNLSVLLIGLTVCTVHPALRMYTVASAAVSLLAFVLFVSETYLGIGRGGMERLISYPFTVWMAVYGLYAFTTLRREQG